MIVFDMPATSESPALRAVALGSCRVTNPVIVLRDRGDVHLLATGLSAHHTAPEALQSLRVATADHAIPDVVSPYIFGTERTPPVDHLRGLIVGGVDVFLLEVCADRQFSYGEILLQENFVTRNLVQPSGGALLDWYREVCRGRAPDEACVAATLERLKQRGLDPSDAMADLLRGVRLSTQAGEEIADALRTMMSKFSGRWVVVGAFEVPGHQGAIMKDRRALNAKLESAARQCGAAFYDPTHLLLEHGKETALDGGGANIYEYAESFYPVVGQGLTDLARFGRHVRRTSSKSAAADSKGRTGARCFSSGLELAQRVDAELVALHRRRLAASGPTKSGLYSHYQAKVERGSVVESRERAVLDLVEAYLPSYDAYGVLRAGLGELALLLAASGRKVTAYEAEPNRRAAIEAGREHLEQIGLLASGALTVLTSITPESALPGSTLGIGLGVVQVLDESAAAPLLERMRFFEALLIDLRAFLRIRETPADKAAAIVGLRAIGFDSRRHYPADELSWFQKSNPGAGRLSWV
jgi:hypothetical protein